MSKLITRSVLPHALPLRDRFLSVRQLTEQLAQPLSAEDQTVQSMPDASPTKWHLAHTTWFFETFLLRPHHAGYRVFDPAYEYLFNSYYEAVGPRHPRPQRGMLTRPGRDEILAYRRHVSDAMVQLIDAGNGDASVVELGVHHEQQHQELILMDIKHMLSMNPLFPAYGAEAPPRVHETAALGWIEFEGGLVEIGHGGNGFAFDNEGPRHRVWVDSFALATRLATCGEYAARCHCCTTSPRVRISGPPKSGSPTPGPALTHSATYAAKSSEATGCVWMLVGSGSRGSFAALPSMRSMSQ